MRTKAVSLTLAILAVLILAGLPQLITIENPELWRMPGTAGYQATVHFDALAPVKSAAMYLRGLFTGEAFEFYAAKIPRNFLDVAPMYLLTSALYLTFSAFFGLNLGIVLGMLSSRLRSGIIKDCIGFLNAVPDFIIILVLQRGAVLLHNATGTRVAKVATVTLSEPAILLPLLVMILIPALYLIRTVSTHTDQVIAQDYIQCAQSRGLPPFYIYLHHVFPNVIPFIKADIHKLAGIMLANMFVTEYLFNIFGITRLLFKSGFQFFRWSYLVNYQYNVVANCLLVVILLYEGLGLLMRGYIKLWEGRLCR